MKTAVIIPAYNERERIGGVISAVKSAETVNEVVVVSDGSSDGTYEYVAAIADIKAVGLTTNQGKAGAMRAGALATDADVILFLDADLTGLDGCKVDSLLKPVVEGSADMVIGIFRGGRKVTDLAQVLAPFISGQRAIRREVFLDIPGLEQVRSGVELAVTKYARSHKFKVITVVLPGCTHCMKEEKLGFAKGFASRVRMYLDIGKILLDGRAFRNKN